MKIAFITAGAAGMYCGSCMHDNTLVAALRRQGHDALLMPTYTPIRTDEEDVSTPRVFFGGINVYLQQKMSLFRWTPWFLDRLFDGPALLRSISRYAFSTRAEELGELTVSMLEGTSGKQRKELRKLVEWTRSHHPAELVQITNVLLSGMAMPLAKELKVPILGTLQGDDIYLEALTPAHREKCLELIRRNDQGFAGYIATSRVYADFMAGYLGIPREKIHVVYPGLNLKGHGPPATRAERPFTIGYFARICVEKGFANLIDGFIAFKKLPGTGPARLRASGWLGPHNRHVLDAGIQKLREAGLEASFEYVDSPSHADKVRFMHSIDVLSVPTVYREPKGLYVLEALANGVPVVQPRHGSFPELIEETQGGLLVEPGDADVLARAWHRLCEHPQERQRMADNGLAAVRRRFHADGMAEETVRVYERFLRRG